MFPARERSAVITLAVGDDAEVGKCVGTRAVFTEASAVFEDALERRAGVVEEALRDERDAAVQASAELGGRLAGSGCGERVLGEVRVRVVPASLDEVDLAERVATAEARRGRLRERDRARGVLGSQLHVTGEVAELGELGRDAGAELVVVCSGLGLLERDASGNEIAELHERAAHEERDGRIVG